MSIILQSKLLRVLEDGYIDPVGAKKQKQVDVRVIAATNKNIKQELKTGNFREDLYYRLNVFPIILPPLRERKMDIKPLTEEFLKNMCEKNGYSPKAFSKDVWNVLLDYDWPGNVRELKNIVERIVVTTKEEVIGQNLIQKAMGKKENENSHFNEEKTLKESRYSFEKDYILKILLKHNGKILETAEALGLERSHLWKKMKLYGIKKE
jgi:two-component system, NtrC family, nitrogen regulation response regulator NtrX